MKNKKILLLCMFFLFVIMLSQTSLGFLQRYSWDDVNKKAIIKNWLGKELYEVKLVDNTDYCLINCEATLKIKANYDVGIGVLLNSLKFYDKFGRDGEKLLYDYDIYLVRNVSYFVDVPDYEEKCEFVRVENLTNQTMQKVCKRVKVGSHKEKRWKIEEVKLGNGGDFVRSLGKIKQSLRNNEEIIVKIRGKKKPYASVDWVPEFYGLEIKEMAWWNSNWEKKRAITITENSGNTLTNYSVMLNISYDSDMQADFDDLRFTDSSETQELGYWIEEKQDGNYAIVWVKVPELQASSDTTIYMYYKNPSASSESNINDTFLFFEDFDTLDTNKWVWKGSCSVSGGILTCTQGAGEGITYKIRQFSNVSAIARMNSAGANPALNLYIRNPDNDGSTRGYHLYSQLNSVTYEFKLYRDSTQIADNSTTDIADHYYIYEIRGAGNRIEAYRKDDDTDKRITKPVQKSLIGSDGTYSSGYVTMAGEWTDKTMYVDWVIVRAYTYVEPTYTMGEEQAGINVELISPPDNTITNQTTQTFTCNITSGSELENVTLYIWNSSNDEIYSNTKQISGTSVEESWTYTLADDDTYSWNCHAYNINGEDAWGSNYTLTIDVTPPEINITSPQTYGYAINSNQTNVSLNYSVSDANLDSCWYELDGEIYNLTSCQNTTLTNISVGSHNLILYANDTAENMNNNEVNFTINKVEYEEEAYETDTSELKLYLYNLDNAPSNTYLVYDGQEYLASISSSGNNYTIIKALDIPVGAGNKTFYFKYNIETSTYYSSNYTQTISPIVFGLCNSTLNTSYLNISFKDEKDLTSINGTIDFSVNYYLGSGTTYKTLHYTNNTENSHYTFCFSPDDELVNVNGTIIFSSSNYWERRVSFNEIYTSSTTQKTLYLLSYDDGSWARFQVLSSTTSEALSGVTITFYRDFGSGDEVIIRTQTDDVGMSASWIDPDYTYLITFEKEGYTTGSYNMQISDSNTRYIYLAEITGAEGGWNYTNMSSFSYQTYPPATINLIPNLNYTFGIYLISDGDDLNVSMNLYCNDTLIYSNYDIDSIVNLSYNFNISNCYQIKVAYVVSTNEGEDSIKLLTFYSVYNILVGDLSLYSFLTAFDDYDFGVIGNWFKFIIALFLVITVAGVFYKLEGIDSLDSAITSIIAVLVVIWIFSYVGWLSLGATWIAKYSIALLTSILGGVFIIWKLTTT